MRALDWHREHGHSIAPQIAKFATRWNGSVYRCDPSRKMPLSSETIRRVFYKRWLRSGRKAEALQHRFVTGSQLVLDATQRRRLPHLLSICTSMRQLACKLSAGKPQRISTDSLERLFSIDARIVIRAAFAARRAHQRAELRFAKLLKQAGGLV
jgi:hypothetical protein